MYFFGFLGSLSKRKENKMYNPTIDIYEKISTNNSTQKHLSYLYRYPKKNVLNFKRR